MFYHTLKILESVFENDCKTCFCLEAEDLKSQMTNLYKLLYVI